MDLHSEFGYANVVVSQINVKQYLFSMAPPGIKCGNRCVRVGCSISGTALVPKLNAK